MDLSSLSIIELRDLEQQIPLEIKRREVQDKQNILNEVRAFAKARGYAIEDLLAKDIKVKSASGNKVKVKYRHPQNPEQEWTGRGRKPKWVESWLSSGGALDGLLV